MNEQAEQMKHYVHDLASVVGGGKEKSQTGSREAVPDEDPDRLLVVSSDNRQGIRGRQALPLPSRNRKGNAFKSTGAKGTAEPRPSKVIPFDDADLSSF